MMDLIDFDHFCYHIDIVSLNISDPLILVIAPLVFLDSTHCVGGCWDRTQDCCDFGRLDLIHTVPVAP